MNILFITDDITSTGGAVTFARELAKEFSKKHKVYIISGNQNVSKGNTSLNKKIKIFFYKSKKIPFIELDIGALIYLPKIFDQVIKEIHPDVIYLHLYSSSFSILLLRRKNKIPLYLYTYGIWYKETLSSISRPKKYKNLGRIKRLLFHGIHIIQQYLIQLFCVIRSKHIITLSNYQKNLLIRTFPIDKSKVHIIHGGYNPQIFYPISKTKKALLRKKLGFSDNTNILLIASRIERRKNIHLGLQAMQQIIKKHRNTILLIVFPFSAHSYFNYLLECFEIVERLALGNHVRFITGIEHNRLSIYYQIADCFLMLSEEYETFGLTTLESLACGTPVFGISSGGTKEILMHINKFFHINIINPNANISKIISKKISIYFSLNEKEKIYTMSKIKKTIFSYTWKNVCKKLIEIQNL